MTKLLDDEAQTVHARIRMLTLLGVAVFLVRIAVLAIKEGEFAGLIAILVFGFVFTEILRRKGMFALNRDQDKVLQRIRKVQRPEMAWKQICSALDSRHFDYARMDMKISGREKVFTWQRNEYNDNEPQFDFQVTLPLDQFGLEPGSLVVGKDISREPITKQALAWIEKVKEDTDTEQRR
jgi:hypothetical protein